MVGLHKYAGQKVRQRGSSPKFQTLNNAFVTCQSELTFQQARKDHSYWGRLAESAVGAHLVNESHSENAGIFYWREGQKEVDYVVKRGTSISAIEVKSGTEEGNLSGMDEFSKKFKPKRVLLVGSGGVSLDQFLGNAIGNWID